MARPELQRTLPGPQRPGRPQRKLTLRHNTKLHHIGIGRDRAHTRVLIVIRELDIRIVAEETGELIRELTLDPSRDYQPKDRKV